MAIFITKSFTWGGKETYDYFLKPQFIGKSPAETQGVRVIPNVQSSQKLNYFGTASKILKAYAKGFNGATGTTLSQRTLTTARLKAEASDDASAFYQTVYESALRKDDWINLDGTVLKQIIIDIYSNALASDIYRIFWLANPYKETLSSNVYSGTADVDYNQLTGMWKLIFASAATSPSSTQIKRIAVSDGAVAQVQTGTTSGSSGTANVNVNGVDYLATFATDLTTTNANFVTAYGAALALRDITVTASTNTLIFTSSIPGQAFATVTYTNVSGNLAGTVAATTANTAPASLSAGESKDTFQLMFEGQPTVMKSMPDAEKVLLVDRLIYENYQAYLETLSTVVSNSKLENGVTVLTYRGIPVIPMDWSHHLQADFPHAAGALHAYPHRAILTTTGNLVLGLDAMNQYTGVDMWFNKDLEENRFRAKLIMGAQYVHNELMVVAY